MGNKQTLTDSQKQQIFNLKDDGLSIRAIAAELGITKAVVESALKKRVGTEAQQKIAAMVATPAAREVQRSVFDIMARLEECLVEIEELKDEPGILRDRVAVRSEKRMLIAEARATLESIYNIRVLNDFISEVTAILESESPGARQRIYKRLEASTGATAAVGLFANS